MAPLGNVSEAEGGVLGASPLRAVLPSSSGVPLALHTATGRLLPGRQHPQQPNTVLHTKPLPPLAGGRSDRTACHPTHSGETWSLNGGEN